MDEFTSSHGDISREAVSGERRAQSWKAMAPILHRSESFGLARSFQLAGCTAPLAALTSLGADYIDRFMEPVLLHDPAGTSKTYFWPIHARKIYTPAKRTSFCFILSPPPVLIIVVLRYLFTFVDG